MSPLVKQIPALAVVMMILFSGSASGTARIAAGPPMYLKFLDLEKGADGRVSQEFELVCHPQNARDVRVFFLENGDPTLYRADLYNRRLSISAHRPARIHVLATARAGETVLTAAANLVLYGKSDKPAQRVQAGPDDACALFSLPYIEQVLPPNYYWPQTGQTLQFRFRFPFGWNSGGPGSPGRPGSLMVLENDKIRQVPADARLWFPYTPPHDARLRKQGHTATRQDTLFTRFQQGTTGYALSYTLLLHRSRFAFDNHGAGGWVFAGSLVFFSAWVCMKRRLPWWRA